MTVLGLEASGIVASVALVSDDKLIAEYTINHKRTHSKTLLPMLDEVTCRLDIDINDIDAIASSAGPGSYTGLRISSATAKGIAMALDKPIISVPTMEALAYNVWAAASYICPIADARRERVYTGIYYYSDGVMCEHTAQSVLSIEELLLTARTLLEKDDSFYNDIIFLGDGVFLYQDIINDRLRGRASYAPAHLNMPKASSVAYCAMGYANRKTMDDFISHSPIYLVKPQAEQERLDNDVRGKL